MLLPAWLERLERRIRLSVAARLVSEGIRPSVAASLVSEVH